MIKNCDVVSLIHRGESVIKHKKQADMNINTGKSVNSRTINGANIIIAMAKPTKPVEMSQLRN